MDYEKHLAERGISRSYPFNSIAKKHDVSYTDVLLIADNRREANQDLGHDHTHPYRMTPHQQNALDNLLELDPESMHHLLEDIDVAGAHFEAVQRGQIPAFV